ncbi:hypothetical protein PDIG_39530 [Penicillium digitatum PHI26]|uniref:Uncharacterized protein n=2 Tax=Penicillium digitatum TaxID=36651 RepID=K9GED9_PEND2|nr:hypothetical protein PDIP_25070 [Penicillium digitatum Pd1]EKV13178.1 hypothetical protein PDIG_39530 [Penicillium digitatum PHI26]EKV18937.1 hypothetical protein PDIP_25070 [Penicillium digitatum Pd1]
MHFPAQSCAPIVSAATRRISQRHTPNASLVKIGCAELNCRASRGSFVASGCVRFF